MDISSLIEFLGALLGAFVFLGTLLLLVRLIAPGEEHWNKKWEKYSQEDAEFKKQEERERLERIKKL